MGSDAILTTNAEAKSVILDRLPMVESRLFRIPIAANVEVAPIDRATARQQRLDRGAAFVQSFCWEVTAQQHSQIYLACLNNRAQSRHRHAMVEAGDLLSLK